MTMEDTMNQTTSALDGAALAANDAPTGFVHLTGCPAGEVKVETYTAVRPAKPADAIPARNLRITRCVQCGAHDVREA